MLNCRTSCFVLTLILFTIASNSCENKPIPRYISEKDSSYSADIRNVSKKINADPANAELYYNRSNAFYFENNYKQALYDINYALTLDSVNPLYFYRKGVYLMAGDTAEAKAAEKSFKKAITIKPDFFDAITDLAKIYLAKQNYSESEAYYVKANKLDPSNPLPYFYLGILSKEMGDTAKAMLLFEKTLVYNDKHFDAIMQLGNFYAEKQDKKALLFFDKAIRINEFSDEALYAKGLFLQKARRYKDAAALYETVAKINPGHIFCRYNLGYLHALFNNPSKAITYLDEAIDLAPEYADAYTLRGLMQEKMKNSTAAYNDFKKAIILDENQKLAKEGLGRININISMP
ncbi:MAG: tetratricopeptide repeat protein [Bacteroidia bacterium]